MIKKKCFYASLILAFGMLAASGPILTSKVEVVDAASDAPTTLEEIDSSLEYLIYGTAGGKKYYMSALSISSSKLKVYDSPTNAGKFKLVVSNLNAEKDTANLTMQLTSNSEYLCHSGKNVAKYAADKTSGVTADKYNWTIKMSKDGSGAFNGFTASYKFQSGDTLKDRYCALNKSSNPEAFKTYEYNPSSYPNLLRFEVLKKTAVTSVTNAKTYLGKTLSLNVNTAGLNKPTFLWKIASGEKDILSFDATNTDSVVLTTKENAKVGDTTKVQCVVTDADGWTKTLTITVTIGAIGDVKSAKAASVTSNLYFKGTIRCIDGDTTYVLDDDGVGIALYKASNDSSYTPAVNDVVEVTGIRGEYSSKPQVINSKIVKVGTSTTKVTPIEVTLDNYTDNEMHGNYMTVTGGLYYKSSSGNYSIMLAGKKIPLTNALFNPDMVKHVFKVTGIVTKGYYVEFKHMDSSSFEELYANATSWAESFLTTTGTICETSKIENNFDEATWNALNNDAYKALTAEEKAYMKTSKAHQYGETIIEEAMARYDYIVGKYNFTNFIERTIEQKSNVTTFGSDDNSVIFLAVSLSVVALAGVAALVLISKKRKISD